MLFFFYDQISFCFSCACLLGTLKMTENNLTCIVFHRSFFNCQNSTCHSSDSFWSKGQDNLVTGVVGSVTAWIGVVTIPTQAKFLF